MYSTPFEGTRTRDIPQNDDELSQPTFYGTVFLNVKGLNGNGDGDGAEVTQ